VLPDPTPDHAQRVLLEETARDRLGAERRCRSPEVLELALLDCELVQQAKLATRVVKPFGVLEVHLERDLVVDPLLEGQVVEPPFDAVGEHDPLEIRARRVALRLVDVAVPQRLVRRFRFDQQPDRAVDLERQVAVLSLDLRLAADVGEPVVAEHVLEEALDALDGLGLAQLRRAGVEEVRDELLEGLSDVDRYRCSVWRRRGWRVRRRISWFNGQIAFGRPLTLPRDVPAARRDTVTCLGMSARRSRKAESRDAKLFACDFHRHHWAS
jgi:hypothetical protein